MRNMKIGNVKISRSINRQLYTVKGVFRGGNGERKAISAVKPFPHNKSKHREELRDLSEENLGELEGGREGGRPVRTDTGGSSQKSTCWDNRWCKRGMDFKQMSFTSILHFSLSEKRGGRRREKSCFFFLF